MDEQAKVGDPLTRRADEGLEDYFSRLEALDPAAMTEERRRMLAALLRAVRYILDRERGGAGPR